MSEQEKKIYEALIKPFPQEALSTDSSRGFDLTSVKAQYITERLNEVLGITGWTHKGTYETLPEGTLFHGELIIKIEDKTNVISSVGYSAGKKNKGDELKSAKTDSLSKAASHIGVANDVFKGLVAPPSSGNRKQVYKNQKSNAPEEEF